MSSPPQIPTRDFPSPEILDGLIVELIDATKGDYKPLPVGTRIDEGAKSIYAGYELVSQKTTGDFQWVQRFWCNQASNQNLYNSSIKFDGDDTDFPIFIRTYVERRPFTPRAKGQPLGAVLGAVVTNGGSGYTVAPTVTLTGGTGTGATAQAIIYRGSVVYIRITNEGTGYTTVPTVVFGSGTAAATAYIQPASAILTSEEVGKLPRDDPRFGLYDLVQRVYETIPGAIIPVSNSIDTRSAMEVSVTKQKKAIASITEGVERALDNSKVTKTEAEGIPGDSTYAYEVVTVYKKGPHFDFSTSKKDSKNRQYVFPGYVLSYGEYGGVTITAIDLFGGDVGVKSGVSSDVEVIFSTYFVISDTKPVVAYDQIIYGTAYINGKNYNRVLFDDLTRTWGSFGVYTQPHTTPSATEYRGSSGTITTGDPPPSPFGPGTGDDKWVGTYRKPEAPDIEHYLAPDFLWMVKECQIFMRDSAS